MEFEVPFAFKGDGEAASDISVVVLMHLHLVLSVVDALEDMSAGWRIVNFAHAEYGSWGSVKPVVIISYIALALVKGCILAAGHFQLQ